MSANSNYIEDSKVSQPLDVFYAGTNASVPENHNKKYEINAQSIVDGIAIAKFFGVGSLYSVGVKAAELNQRVSALGLNKQGYTVPDGSPNTPYLPDALPNKFGGYDKTVGWDGKMSSSLIGMPVMCYLKIVGGSYTDLKGNTQTIPDIIFETVVITLDMNKNIEESTIFGRDTGSVKESISLGDWKVEIRALITADAPVNDTISKRNQIGVYPRENMQAIWKALKAPIALPIECWFLQQFDIEYLVFKNANIQQIEGEYSMQRLEINSVSDNPLIITIAS